MDKIYSDYHKEKRKRKRVSDLKKFQLNHAVDNFFGATLDTIFAQLEIDYDESSSLQVFSDSNQKKIIRLRAYFK